MRAAATTVALASAMLLTTTSAHAHMMPAQTITLNVRGAAVFGAFSIPVSALTGWDDDRNGRMTVPELARHLVAIRRQLDAGIVIGSGTATGRRDLLQPSVELDERDAAATGGGTHLLVLVKQTFVAAPSSLLFRTTLFGRATEERRFIVRASGAGAPEVAIVTAADDSHEFYGSTRQVIARFFAPLRTLIERVLT